MSATFDKNSISLSWEMIKSWMGNSIWSTLLFCWMANLKGKGQKKKLIGVILDPVFVVLFHVIFVQNISN